MKPTPTVFAVAMHEAGHNVIARCLEFRAAGCSVRVFADGSHDASSEIQLGRPLYDQSSILEFLRSRVQVLYAGALAEALSLTGEIDGTAALVCFEHRGGRTDSVRVKELIHLVRNITFPDTTDEDEAQKQLNELTNELWNKAAVLVQNEAQTIRAVARHIAAQFSTYGVNLTVTAESIEALPEVKSRFVKG